MGVAYRVRLICKVLQNTHHHKTVSTTNYELDTSLLVARMHNQVIARRNFTQAYDKEELDGFFGGEKGYLTGLEV